jgi:large subunit ribosomal protein L25
MNGEVLNISPRVPQSKARRLRRQGYVPGVLYGNSNTSTPVIFDKKHVESFVQHKGEAAIFEVSIDGKTMPVRIREVQRDPVSQEIIHMDLQNVQMDQRIQARIPLKFEGKQTAVKRGLILQQQKDTIEVEGLAKDIPRHISVPLSMLQNARNIRVQDLEIAAELSILDAPSEVVALSLKPAKELDIEPKAETVSIKADNSENEKPDQAEAE